MVGIKEPFPGIPGQGCPMGEAGLDSGGFLTALPFLPITCRHPCVPPSGSPRFS